MRRDPAITSLVGVLMTRREHLQFTGIEPEHSGHAVPLLRIFVIGGPGALSQGSEVLDSLIAMGYGVHLLGSMEEDDRSLERFKGTVSTNRYLAEFGRIMEEDAPDLLIIAKDDHELRRSLMEVIPSSTRVLDSFALTIFATLKDLSGQLIDTRKRLASVELMKEVLLASSETSIMVVDEDLNIVEISNNLQDRIGMAREDCVGKPCFQVTRKFMDSCDRRGETCLMREVLETGRPSHTVREDMRGNGQVRYFTVSAYPLKEPNEGKQQVMIVWKDVTPGLTQVLDRQARAMRENFSAFLQRDKMVALGKLAAAAVHEINNPIQGILTFAKLMRNTLDQGQPSDADIASFKTYLDLIVTESARSGEILRNLLSFARRGDLQRGRVDVHKLFDEVALLLGNRLDLQAISWNASLAEDLPVIEGDKDQLKQGLLNILLNAIDAMPDGGAISVSAQPDATHEHVRITIEDSGPGIPPEIRDKIFEPFFTTKSQGKGVGLGLSVVYGIVTQHGGTIELDGGDGQGAQVVLMLPVSGGTLPEQSPQPPAGDGCLVNGGGIG